MNSALQYLYEQEEAFDAEQEAGEARRLALHADEFGKPIKRKVALGNGKKLARTAIRIATAGDPLQARENLQALCETVGVPFPASDYGTAPEVARLSAVEWWGRKLRVADWRRFEERKIRTGQIDRYCSDEIASAYVHHQHDIATLLDGLLAYREDGEAAFTLKELADKSKANPAVRFAAMIHQVKGVAELAYDAGQTWAFFTLTCPSKFHRMTTGRTGQKLQNPRWNGSLPRDGQQYLVNLWAKFRAKLKREKLDCMYWRVAEPHTDGCPHWHGIVWAKPDDLKKIARLMREFAFQVDGKEPGAWKHRMRWMKYRPWAAKNIAGDARTKEIDACIGYLVAYIGKNVHGRRADGESIGGTRDRYGRAVAGDAIDNAVRTVAWASLWGIRQFQFGGTAKSGPYEELRRLKADDRRDGEIEAARIAADAGDFAGYSRMAHQLDLKLWQETSEDRIRALAAERGLALEATPELAEAVVEAGLLNKWGEPTRRWVLGVQAATNEFQRERTRLHTWRVAALEDVKAIAATMGAAGRRLLDVLRDRTDAMQRAAGEACALLLSALQRPAEPGALGPGSITVRASDGDPGQQTAIEGPPDPDGWLYIPGHGLAPATF